MKTDPQELGWGRFAPDKDESTVCGIPVLNDNYVWLLHTGNDRYVVIDPGEAGPVEQKLSEKAGEIAAILLTHWHTDHVAGVKTLLYGRPAVRIYGPKECAEESISLSIVADQEVVAIGNRQLQVLAVPGHTMGHIAYYSPPYLFCGDTLFSAGCGRCFEGSYASLYASLQTLAALPDGTLVCPGHEYTETNLRFARSMEPSNHIVVQYLKELTVRSQLSGRTVPSAMEFERQINPFLRCAEPEIQRSLGWTRPPSSLDEVFSALRSQKDKFS